MNVERMTARVQEALNSAYQRALAEHNPQTTPEHLLAAILDQDDGIAPAIVQKAGVDLTALKRGVDQIIGQLPRLGGPNADQSQVTVAPQLTRLLSVADNDAKQLQDDYVSVEHLLLALSDDQGPAGNCSASASSTATPCSMR